VHLSSLACDLSTHECRRAAWTHSPPHSTLSFLGPIRVHLSSLACALSTHECRRAAWDTHPLPHSQLCYVERHCITYPIISPSTLPHPPYLLMLNPQLCGGSDHYITQPLFSTSTHSIFFLYPLNMVSTHSICSLPCSLPTIFFSLPTQYVLYPLNMFSTHSI